MRQIVRATLAVSLLSACTQPPAQVTLNGHNDYSRNNAHAFSSYAPSSGQVPAPKYAVPQETVQSAKVSTIGVSDLAPPSKTAEKKDAANINKWTGKPRESEAAAAKPEKQAAKSQPEEFGKPVALVHPAAGDTSTMLWPVASRKVISSFGPQGKGRVNDGVNIASASGEPVWAAADGEVVYAGDEMKGYGNMVILKHEGGKSTSYAHLGQASVEKYDRVKQGDIIGYVGSTGSAGKKSQLYFSVRDSKNNPVDPMKQVSNKLAGL